MEPKIESALESNLRYLKGIGIPVSEVEKELGFSNGLIGKAAKGKTKLSPEKMKKLEDYTSKKVNETIDNHIKKGEDLLLSGGSKNLPQITEKDLSEIMKKPDFMAPKTEFFDSPKLENPNDEPPMFPALKMPKLPEPWVQKVEDYCGMVGITPEELIAQHKAKTGFKPAQLTQKEAIKQENIHTIVNDLNDAARPKGGYDPFKNPRFSKLHGPKTD